MATPANPIGQAGFSGPVQFNYYPLLSDGDDIVSRPASIASGGGIVRRGAIVKWDPATGLITQPVAATDCNAIVVNDVDATSATQAALVYVSGKFKADAVIWPGALSHALVTENLRLHSMLIESVEFIDGSLVKSAPTEAQAALAQKQVEANRDSASKAVAAEPDPTKAPSSDSPWAYLTPEERENQPNLAEVHTKEETTGEDEGEGKPEEKPATPPKPAHQPAHQPGHQPVHPPQPQPKKRGDD
jgi:hypothetical protein